MTKKQQIKLFEDKKVRVAWDDELQEWFFSVVDAVEVLTDSKDPKDYLKKMRKREPELDVFCFYYICGTSCATICFHLVLREYLIPQLFLYLYIRPPSAYVRCHGGQAPVTGREYFNLTRSGRGTSTEVAQKQCPCPCTDLVMRV